MTGTAIKTNGEGKRSDYHINRTVTIGLPEPKQPNQWTPKVQVIRTIIPV